MDNGIDQGVAQRVDAYRGNPQALQQKYAVSQELVDLLALQKIKSEKEAAARQMQMQMAQQQAANGEPPTVAEQREKEVMDMTKQEMMQQQAGIMQQKQKQQQEGMQKLAQGIAGAPGAQTAAQPQMMAAGGIVAFAGPDGSDVKDPAYEAILQSIYRRYPNMSDEQKRAKANEMYQRQKGALDRQADAADPDTALILGAEGDLPPRTLPIPGAKFPPTGAGAGRGAYPGYDAEADARAKGQAQAQAPAPTAPDTSALKEQIQSALAQPQGPGIAALRPSTMPAMGETAQPNGVAALLGKDPNAMARAGREEGLSFLGMPQAEREARAKQRAEVEALDAQQLSPERMRQQQLENFLLGAAGQGSVGRALGAGGRSAVNFERSQQDAQRRRLLERQKMLRDEFDIDKGVREKAFETGEKRFGEGAADVRAGAQFSTSARNTDVQLKSAGLDRDSRERIAEMQSRVQQEVAQATRENTLEVKKQSLISTITNNKSKAEKDVRTQFDKKMAPLLQMQAMTGKLTPAQQTQLDQLEAAQERALQAVSGPFDELLDTLGGGYTVKKKTEPKK